MLILCLTSYGPNVDGCYISFAAKNVVSLKFNDFHFL